MSEQAQQTQATSTLTFITESLPAMEVGEEYAVWLEVSGGTAPYSFEVTQGTLPAGIEVTAAGTVNGVPLEAGDTTFRVKATDSAGNYVTQAFNAEVTAQPDPNGDGGPSTGGPLTFETESLPAFTIGDVYNFEIVAVGGTLPYNFQVTQGSLPAGIALSPTGTLTGTPTQAEGTTAFIKLSDSAGAHVTQAFDCQVS